MATSETTHVSTERPCIGRQYTRDGRLRGSEKPIPGRCAHKLKGTNPPRYCQQWPLRGRNACRFCGGKTPRGVASPNFDGKGYSKDLPVALKKRYDATDDAVLTSLREDLRLADVLVHEIASKLKTRDSAACWKSLREAYGELDAAIRSGNMDGMKLSLAALGTIIKDGAEDAAVRDEVFRALDRKGKIAQREWDRMVDMQQMITAEQLMAFVTSWSMSMKDGIERQWRKMLEIMTTYETVVNATGNDVLRASLGPVVEFARKGARETLIMIANKQRELQHVKPADK